MMYYPFFIFEEIGVVPDFIHETTKIHEKSIYDVLSIL
jgi:hypothetical protein